MKPFKYTYEKEIVMYAFFKKLDYFSTECIYAPYAARGAAREFVKDLEVRAFLSCVRIPHLSAYYHKHCTFIANCLSCGSSPCAPCNTGQRLCSLRIANSMSD